MVVHEYKVRAAGHSSYMTNSTSFSKNIEILNGDEFMISCSFVALGRNLWKGVERQKVLSHFGLVVFPVS